MTQPKEKRTRYGYEPGLTKDLGHDALVARLLTQSPPAGMTLAKKVCDYHIPSLVHEANGVFILAPVAYVGPLSRIIAPLARRLLGESYAIVARVEVQSDYGGTYRIEGQYRGEAVQQIVSRFVRIAGESLGASYVTNPLADFDTVRVTLPR